MGWLEDLYKWVGGSTYQSYLTNSRESRDRAAKRELYKSTKERKALNSATKSNTSKKTTTSKGGSKISSGSGGSGGSSGSSGSSGSGGSGGSSGGGGTTSNAVIEDVTGNAIKSQNLEPIENKFNDYTPRWEDDNEGWKQSSNRPNVHIFISYEKYEANTEQQKSSEADE